MKFRLKIATFIILSDILIDFVLSIVFSIWADRETWADYNNATNRTEEQQGIHAHTKDGVFSWPPFLHNFNFFVSQLDFIFLSLLRLSVLCGAFAGILKNRLDGPSKLACSSKAAFLGFICIAMFSFVKLLALAEIRSTFYDVPFFWLNFAGNFLFSASAFCCWSLVLANVLPPPKSPDFQNLNVIVDGSTNDLTGVVANGDVEVHENHSDTARLIDRNEIVETTTPNYPKDNDDKKDGSTETSDDSGDKKTKKEEKVSLKETRSLLLRLALYSLKDWPWYLLGFVFLVVYSAGRMLIPLYTSDALKFITDRSYDSLTGGILKLIGLCVASAIFSGLRGGAFTYASSLMILRIRSTLFLSLLKQEIGFFDTTKTGDITSRLTSDCQTLTDTFTLNVNCFLRNLIMFIGSLIIMLSLSWQLTIIILIMIPLATFITHIFGSIFQKLSTDMQDTLAKGNEVADEVLGSMRTVRSFANERKETEHYDDLLNNTLKILVKRCLFYVMYNGFGELFGPLALVAIIWYGGHLVLTNRMEPNVLLAFVLYQTLLGETIYIMGLSYNGLMEAGGASKKVFELIDRIPKIPNDGDLAPKSVDGRVEFKNVCFSYPSRPSIPVLEDVNFSVEPGEIVALVGPSGGGKSSCIALLEHFYEPTSGEIFLDGVQINRFRHDYYHRKVALVGQEPVLYAKSVAENIAYALNDDEYTQDDIVRVSKLANAHQFIISMNKGYDTYVGEKGAQLSGGQKQRVAIARAIIRKPKILLLDEATSALDAESEHLVQQALYENLAGYTILLIAHRLSTVQRADRIIVISQGRVVQQGKHDELLKVDGLYKNLVQRQLLGDVRQEADSKDNG